MARQSAWVIFDADNTLWDVETLYDGAREAFCAYVEGLVIASNRSAQVDRAFINGLQRHRDIQLHETHGYSAARFARSFEDTLSFLLPFSPPDAVRQVRELALQVFTSQPELTPGLEAVLSALGDGFSLGIITAGERWVQERRLSTFRFLNRFDKVIVVDRKTEAVFEDFCRNQAVDKTQSWVIGDSLRSDVVPATNVGLRAIHFDAANWAIEDSHKPEGVWTARTMHEALALIRDHPGDTLS